MAVQRRRARQALTSNAWSGEVELMLKMIFLCQRRPDIGHDTYVRRLLDGHVPRALRHHPTMQHYHVNIVDERRIARSADLDSIGELYFETLNDYRERLYDSAAGREVIGKDTATFLGAADAYACTEKVHIDATTRTLGERSPGVKVIAALRRASGMTHRHFVDFWLREYVPAALEHRVGLAKYVTNVVDARLDEGAEEIDGIAEFHFATQEDRQRLYASPHARRAVEDITAKFVGRVQAWVVSEYRFK
jgi:hypothetical protein